VTLVARATGRFLPVSHRAASARATGVSERKRTMLLIALISVATFNIGFVVGTWWATRDSKGNDDE